MRAIATLVSNIVLQAAEAWRSGEIKKLDPNPGDGGCQMRGYLLYRYFSNKALGKELEALGEKVSEVADANAFLRRCSEIALSQRMEFILQCRLLALTRAPYKYLANGIVVTRSEVNKLSSGIPLEDRRKIIEVAQYNLSANSVALLRREAEKLTSHDKAHILSMLSPAMVRIYTPNPRKYEPKMFGCLFYEYKAILFRLREERGLVCFKSIVPSGQTPFRILLQPREAGGEFSILPEGGCPDSPMVVFEGVVTNNDKEGFSKRIEEIGFTEWILIAAAIEPPYGTSDWREVREEAARAEIESYRKLAQEIEYQKLLILDHVYCNLLRAEMT